VTGGFNPGKEQTRKNTTARELPGLSHRATTQPPRTVGEERGQRTFCRVQRRISIRCAANVRIALLPRRSELQGPIIMPSPIREAIPSLAPPLVTELQAPPSPRTHRTLRRLQSAHSLGAKASAAGSSSIANPPSLISQQRLQQQQQQHFQQRNLSPVRRDLSAGISNRSPQRGRANSDANLAHHLGSAAAKRSLLKRTNAAANALSLQQLLRDGPPDGDVVGGLESARIKVLDEGIKSDADGMVRLPSPRIPLATFTKSCLESGSAWVANSASF
jgi:hypothetical protein